MASLLVSVESYFHRWIKIYDNIAKIHVPSLHMKRMLIKSGFSEDKISHHFLMINLHDYPYEAKHADYYVYFGRLSPEKGVIRLLEAVRMLERKTPCYIIGDGPQREELERFAREHNLTQVKFLGYKDKEELKHIVANAMFVVVPSECYDNSPVTIYESYALGKPVIGARIGGIPEFIEDGRNGYLFEMGNAGELASRIADLINDPEKIKNFGKNVRRFAEKNFAETDHYNYIIKLYRDLIDNSEKKRG